VAQRLLLATNNPGKVAEYRHLLAELPMDLVTPTQARIEGEPEETGATFEENALLKARYYSERSGLLTLADDSGLEVDALNGGPGVYSARYGGPGISDSDRVNKLLKALEGVPWERRTARFRCVITIVWPSGVSELFEGRCDGKIAQAASGSGGFGYDPIFYIPMLRKTMAELTAEEKNRISHRGRAARKVLKAFKERRAIIRKRESMKRRQLSNFAELRRKEPKVSFWNRGTRVISGLLRRPKGE